MMKYLYFQAKSCLLPKPDKGLNSRECDFKHPLRASDLVGILTEMVCMEKPRQTKFYDKDIARMALNALVRFECTNDMRFFMGASYATNAESPTLPRVRIGNVDVKGVYEHYLLDWYLSSRKEAKTDLYSLFAKLTNTDNPSGKMSLVDILTIWRENLGTDEVRSFLAKYPEFVFKRGVESFLPNTFRKIFSLKDEELLKLQRNQDKLEITESNATYRVQFPFNVKGKPREAMSYDIEVLTAIDCEWYDEMINNCSLFPQVLDGGMIEDFHYTDYCYIDNPIDNGFEPIYKNFSLPNE